MLSIFSLPLPATPLPSFLLPPHIKTQAHIEETQIHYRTQDVLWHQGFMTHIILHGMSCAGIMDSHLSSVMEKAFCARYIHSNLSLRPQFPNVYLSQYITCVKRPPALKENTLLQSFERFLKTGLTVDVSLHFVA